MEVKLLQNWSYDATSKPKAQLQILKAKVPNLNPKLLNYIPNQKRHLFKLLWAVKATVPSARSKAKARRDEAICGFLHGCVSAALWLFTDNPRAHYSGLWNNLPLLREARKKWYVYVKSPKGGQPGQTTCLKWLPSPHANC